MGLLCFWLVFRKFLSRLHEKFSFIRRSVCNMHGLLVSMCHVRGACANSMSSDGLSARTLAAGVAGINEM